MLSVHAITSITKTTTTPKKLKIYAKADTITSDFNSESIAIASDSFSTFPGYQYTLTLENVSITDSNILYPDNLNFLPAIIIANTPGLNGENFLIFEKLKNGTSSYTFTANSYKTFLNLGSALYSDNATIPARFTITLSKLKVTAPHGEIDTIATFGNGYTSNKATYSFGFNGKYNIDEVMGKRRWQDYGDRMYSPDLIRFPSPDKLTGEYPWYSPYQFAGNTPIQAIDLDGEEPSYIIDKSGKVSNPVVGFLNKAFGYSNSSLKGTTWHPQGDLWKYNPSKSIVGGIALNSFAGAITLSKDIFYRSSYKQSFTPRQWLGLIGHEQSHAFDYETMGIGNFVGTYIIETVLSFDATGQETEILAYGREKTLLGWLGKNKNLVYALSNNSLTEQQKLDVALTEGKFFRYEVGIDYEISMIDKKLNGINDALTKAKIQYTNAIVNKSKLLKIHESNVNQLEKNKSSYETQKTNLILEKEKLGDEICN